MADTYTYISTPPFPFEILSVIEKHPTAGSVGATLDIVKVPNGSAASAGTSILAAVFDLTSTANTAVMKTALKLNGNRSFDPLDSVAIKVSGVAADSNGVQVTLYCKPLNMGQFRNYGTS